MFVSGTSTVATLCAATHMFPQTHAHKAYVCCLSVDFETGGEETKVRLWWREHWQTRYSSKEAEEEVTMPTQTPRVQQVRAKIASSPHHLRSPRPRSKSPEKRSRQAARIRSCPLQRFSPPFPTPAALMTPTTVVGFVRILGKQVGLIAIATLGLLGWDSIPREGEEPEPPVRCVRWFMSGKGQSRHHVTIGLLSPFSINDMSPILCI